VDGEALAMGTGMRIKARLNVGVAVGIIGLKY